MPEPRVFRHIAGWGRTVPGTRPRHDFARQFASSMSVTSPAETSPKSEPQAGAERSAFRISLAWRFFLFVALLLALVVGVAALSMKLPGNFAMIVAGAVLVAAPVAWLLARATLAPLARMAQATQQAAAGDYRVRMGVDADDEFGQLAQSFDALCAGLAERAALGAYAAAAARRGSAGAAQGAFAARGRDVPSIDLGVTHGQPTLLGIDLRRFAEPVDPDAVAAILASLADAVRTAVAVAKEQGGRLLTAGATRLVFGFEGADRLPRALECARRILDADARTAAALLEGEAAAGSIEFQPGAIVSTLFGPASQQIERLLSESPAEMVMLSRGLGDAAKALLGETRVGVTQGMLSSKPFYSVRGQDLGALAPMAPVTTTQPTAAATSATRIAGRYELLAESGRGAYGAVYKAHDLQGGALVQLELTDPSVPAESSPLSVDRDALERATRLAHPNVVRVLELGEHGGHPFLATEYVEAPSLQQALRHCGPMPLAAALRLARQLCAGMAAAHALGLVHGDIRAGTILLDADGSVKLAGFGGASRREARAGAVDTAAGDAPASRPDMREDIHAFGLVMREAFDATMPAADATSDAGLAGDAAAAAALNALIRSCIRAESGPQLARTDEVCAALDQIRT